MAHQLGAPLPGVPPPQPQHYGHEMHPQHGHDDLEEIDSSRAPRNCPRTHPWCSVAGCTERPLRQYLSAATNQVRSGEQDEINPFCWSLSRLQRRLIYSASQGEHSSLAPRHDVCPLLSLSLPGNEICALPLSLSRWLSGIVGQRPAAECYNTMENLRRVAPISRHFVLPRFFLFFFNVVPSPVSLSSFVDDVMRMGK